MTLSSIALLPSDQVDSASPSRAASVQLPCSATPFTTVITLHHKVLDDGASNVYRVVVPDAMKSSASRNVPVAIDAHAEETLRYIRSTMDAASLVVAPGSAGVLIGLVGVIAAVLAAGPWREHWLTVWIGTAPIACVIGAAVMARQQRLHGRTLFGPSGRRFVLCFAPAILGGAVLTAADLYDGNFRVVAGTWLLLYGCAVIAASAATTRLIGVLGSLFALLGVAALLMPSSTHNALLGLGFGGLHLVFGAYLAGRKSHAG